MNRCGIALLVALLLCLLCAGALAAGEIPIKVQVVVDPAVFTEPVTANITIRVTNVSDRALPGPVTLFYPNGKQIEGYEPELEAGASKAWEGTWDVTQAQLDAGKITFKIKYSMYDENGEVISKAQNMPKTITYNGMVATVEVNRTITPTTAGKGQSVSVTYDVVNTGNVELTEVSITEDSSIASQRGNIGTIAPGEKGTYTFSAKMGSKDLTSRATVSYKAGGQTLTATKEAATIKYGEVKLKASLTADKKGGLTGESVKLSLSLQNTGKDDYENLTVRDATLGEVFSGITVRANETRTFDTTVPISATTDYQFVISGADSAGSTIETASDRLTVTAINPGEVISLDVFATVDQELVHALPAIVRFTVSVTNRSAAEVSNVRVVAGDNTLYTFSTIASGATASFTRDVQINMGGRFQFGATVRNQLGETQRFDSNVLQLSYAAPTAVPTEVPLVTPPPPVIESIPGPEDLPSWYDTAGRALNWAAIALAAVAAIGAVLLLIGCVNRLIARKDRIEPMDTLDGLELLQHMDPEELPADDSAQEETVAAVEAATSRRRRAQSQSAEPAEQAGQADETKA